MSEEKKRERETLLQRTRELDAQIAENEKFQQEFEVKLCCAKSNGASKSG